MWTLWTLFALSPIGSLKAIEPFVRSPRETLFDSHDVGVRTIHADSTVGSVRTNDVTRVLGGVVAVGDDQVAITVDRGVVDVPTGTRRTLFTIGARRAGRALDPRALLYGRLNDAGCDNGRIAHRETSPVTVKFPAMKV
ncbi:MAG: hypothetical protein ABS78_22110 [Phenylobacterium sp. SCN 70-31]|nr:MAG: hypothetical protein ABS78_22110 [Phenylobacterium sp. SCN 70-31]